MTTPMLALLLMAAAADGAPRVTAAAAKAEVRLGEVFVVELTASGPPGTAFDFPQEAGNEALLLRELAAAPGDASPPPPGVRRYDAMALALGDVELPAIAVPYRLPDGSSGTVLTEPLPLRVDSVLPKDPKQQKLADIRAPVPLATGAAFWVALAAVLVLVAAAVVAWHRRRRPGTAAADAAPPLAPADEAILALDRLDADGLLDRGDFRAYYIGLSEIAKRYLERRLAAPVLEMTTTEMAAFLRDHPQAAPFTGAARELAGAADRVKFARGAGLEDEARRHLKVARSLVRGIEERFRPREQVA